MPAVASAEQEDRQQQARLGDAGRLRRDIGVAHRDQRAPEAALRDVGVIQVHERGHMPRQRVETRTRCRTAPATPARHADAAARHALPGQRDLRHDGREAERRDREVERAQPQGRKSDDHAEHGADDSPRSPSAAKGGTGGRTLPAASTLAV